MNAESQAVVAIAMSFVDLLNDIAPGWIKGYLRFSMWGAGHGSNASYASESGVKIVDPFMSADFFAKLNATGVELLKELKKNQGVFLVVIDSALNYEVKFEFEDLERWKITKLNGASGIPIGL